MDNSVVITGIGSITPAGTGNGALLDVLKNGISCALKLDFDNEDIVNCVGAPIPDFSVNDFIPFKYSKRLDRGEQLFAAACLMAMEDSGLDFKNHERAGIYQGTALGGLPHALAAQDAYRKNGFSSVSPLTVLGAMTGAGSAIVALLMGVKGPNMSFSTASLSSAVAFIAAVDALRLGKLDAMIVGGGEAPLVWQLYLMFERANMLASGWNDRPKQACRPFDKDRNGLVLAEAGAALVLERLEVATKRNAHIYAEVGGVALTNDAYNLVAPEPEPLQKSRAMVQALEQAGIGAVQLSHIIAHGTSTQLNDPVETKAVKLALGEMAYHVPINSIKSMLGHAQGACTAVELVSAVLAMQHSFHPPTINLTVPDPDCDLDYVANHSRLGPINNVLVNNASFGGRNSSICLLKWDG
jgi:3-oxoacyl-[acyl-carrier-protein] synthase II